ncbi:MAG: DUF448 domain-containing protein [Campylobacteraceae bacterium]|nr:DUF448 domain-containing protein [Campylobacteraceae bacterium]
MANLKKSLRTCIVCRSKLEKAYLLRLRCENKKLVPYQNYGRSFYICNQCLDESFGVTNETENLKSIKKLEKSLFRECKNKDEYIVQLKEILTNVR